MAQSLHEREIAEIQDMIADARRMSSRIRRRTDWFVRHMARESALFQREMRLLTASQRETARLVESFIRSRH